MNKTYVLTRLNPDFEEIIDAGQDLNSLTSQIKSSDEYYSYYIYSFPGNEQVYPPPIKRERPDKAETGLCQPSIRIESDGKIRAGDLISHPKSGTTWVVTSASLQTTEIIPTEPIKPMEVWPMKSSEFVVIASSAHENSIFPKPSEGKVFDATISDMCKRDEDGQKFTFEP